MTKQTKILTSLLLVCTQFFYRQEKHRSYKYKSIKHSRFKIPHQMACSKCYESSAVLSLWFLSHRNRRTIKRDPRRLSKLWNEPSSILLKTPLRSSFPDHECSWEKQISLPTKSPPLFSSKFSKFGFSPQNRFNRSWNRFNRFWYCSSCHLCSDLSDSQSCQKSRSRYFSETGWAEIWSYSAGFETGPVSGWVDQWTGIPLVETGSTGLKTGSTGFCPFSPNGCQLLGDPLYNPSHSLSHLLLPLPRIFGWPTLKQEHSLHLSHPQSHLLQSFEGPLVWGELDRTRCQFHLDSPILLFLSSLQT